MSSNCSWYITPLMILSSCGHTDIVVALIQSGTNINKTGEFGQTALDYALHAYVLNFTLGGDISTT